VQCRRALRFKNARWRKGKSAKDLTKLRGGGLGEGQKTRKGKGSNCQVTILLSCGGREQKERNDVTSKQNTNFGERNLSERGKDQRADQRKKGNGCKSRNKRGKIGTSQSKKYHSVAAGIRARVREGKRGNDRIIVVWRERKEWRTRKIEGREVGEKKGIVVELYA